MRMLPLSCCLLAAACSGDDETTAPPPEASCDDITSAPLGEVDVNDWPDGLPEAIADYNLIGGRYEAVASEACGVGVVAVKLIPATQEELLIVTETWPAADILTCGCVADTKFGDDTAYAIAAQIPAFEFYIESFGDPGIDNQNVVGTGALFSPSAPLTMRQCGTKDVDPILGSAYDQFTTILRIEDGLLTGGLSLAKIDGTRVDCELSDFELIEAL
jgi:hypothetical protein